MIRKDTTEGLDVTANTLQLRWTEPEELGEKLKDHRRWTCFYMTDSGKVAKVASIEEKKTDRVKWWTKKSKHIDRTVEFHPEFARYGKDQDILKFNGSVRSIQKWVNNEIAIMYRDLAPNKAHLEHWGGLVLKKPLYKQALSQ